MYEEDWVTYRTQRNGFDADRCLSDILRYRTCKAKEPEANAVGDSAILHRKVASDPPCQMIPGDLSFARTPLGTLLNRRCVTRFKKNSIFNNGIFCFLFVFVFL